MFTIMRILIVATAIYLSIALYRLFNTHEEENASSRRGPTFVFMSRHVLLLATN